MESSVFMLKPFVDKFYEEATIYKKHIETLEKRNKELEEKLARLESQSRKKKPEVCVIGDDDDVYADEALAPPASSLEPIKEEKLVVITEKNNTPQEENKQVNLTIDKNRKEYMKEYQRNYRKKQKEIALNL